MFQTDSEVQEKFIVQHQPLPTLPSLFTPKALLFSAGVSILYLLISRILIGFHTDQLILVILFNTLYFASRITRRLITGFSVFIVYWILFDYMKAFPNYLYNTVNIESLYNFEKQLFGINWNNTIITPNEFFHQHNAPVVDVLAGIFYLCWVPVPLLFAGIMFFKNRKYFFYFSLTFFLVNILGFIGYYVYPAAPPWYVVQHGFDFIAHTPGNTGGLARFDSYLGTGIFAGMYSKSSNVFAAMPSMHASFMLIVLYYSIKTKWKKIYNIIFAIIMLGIWFTAVYTSHHYILDVLAGIGCAIIAIFSLRYFVEETKPGRKLLRNLMAATAK